MLQKIHIFVNSGKGIQVQYKIDEKDWETLGKVDDTQTELIFPSGLRCKRIKFRIAKTSSEGRFSFEGFDIYFTPEGLIE